MTDSPNSPNSVKKHIHRLKNYLPPTYLIPLIELTLELDRQKTWVRAKIHLQKNSDAPCPGLFLNGEDLELQEIRVDGRETDAYRIDREGLTLFNPPESFFLETCVTVCPQSNTRLEGLYLSGDILCSQCEAEGFRRITYTLDRPDILSVFTVTLIADGKDYPILLSNGNHDLQRSGQEADGRLREVFVDPFPKPAYLFAIVAGKMDVLEDEFTTLSGRRVNLSIYSEPGKIDKCGFAMESLKSSMQWEEKVYGLEYDLDDYKIVAVDTFNMGAMENKGLNIFNSALVIYDEHTATDLDRQRIAVTIAHEYFHNWTGNRVTVRDWFQLTLKEGLTVYRDRCFSADHYSPVVERIRNATLLRSLQYPEDNGPLAHPIQPDTYESINNFYTLTVYEKGAEVVGMYETLLGKSKFIHGVRQYLGHFDGQAATVNDFFNSMQSMTPRDLSRFLLWYHTPGTPVIEVETQYHPEEKTFRVRLSQSIPSRSDRGPEAEPLLIPLGFSVNVKRGERIISIHHGLWILEDREETRIFNEVESPPRLSLNENFSAPVKVIRDFTLSDWIQQFRYEQNPFLKWDAFQQCYFQLFKEKMEDPAMDLGLPIRQLVEVMKPIWEPIISAFSEEDSARHFLEHGQNDQQHYGDCSFLARMLTFPEFAELVERVPTIDFVIIQSFIQEVKATFVREARGLLETLYTTLDRIHNHHPFTGKETKGRRNPAGERELKNICLKWLAGEGRQEWALTQWRTAQARSSFNDELMAFRCVLLQPGAFGEQTIQEFYQRWRKDNLVINRWLEAVAGIEDETTLNRIIEIQGIPEFTLKEPNKCRSLFRSFIRNNPFIFNHPSGEGYRLIADIVIRLDQINPLNAADLLVYWPALEKLEEPQKTLMGQELERLQNHARSKDVLEIVEKRLGSS